MKISENTAISMPMRNLIAILIAVAAGVWAYSEIQDFKNTKGKKNCKKKNGDAR